MDDDGGACGGGWATSAPIETENAVTAGYKY